MTYIITGFIGLIKLIVGLFPDASSIDLSGFELNMVIAGLNQWIDLNTLMIVVNMSISFYVVMGSVFLINWIIKRVRGG
jgi:hypothetical protein